jgi:hypothetical protein
LPRWTEATTNLGGSDVAERALELLRRSLWATRATRASAEEPDARASARDELERELTTAQERIARLNDGGRRTEAGRELETYWGLVRTLHDGLVQYCQSYPGAFSEAFGQPAAERLIEASFSRCFFFEGLWDLVTGLEPKALAAFLAEHLRFHLSGSAREGSAGIVEEEDRYRLIFHPCGSGGAMRRRMGAEPPPSEVLSTPSPVSWGLAGQVPYYCAHCALNELQSIRRVGYPAFVTEFDPDPTAPCGWTVYKDPSLIPERVFERVGRRKDLAAFRPAY